MKKTGLATQQDLLNWANTTAARSEFPRLIRRLVLETGDNPSLVDFPAGEGTVTGGWDGVSVCDGTATFVPAGMALWELSVGRATTSKADSDYEKRFETPDGRPATQATYVQVILRRWTERKKWAKERSKDGRWTQVRAYGVDSVETWLESTPATHAWISELLGLTPYGIRGIEGWWERWSTSTDPALTPSLVLAGRESSAEELRRELSGGPSITTVDAASLDEALGVIAAAILGAEDAERLGARAIFVDKVESWRELAAKPGPLVLVACSPEVIAEAEVAKSHHVVVPTIGARSADIEFPSVEAAVFAERLEELETDREKAHDLARLARRSLPALRRRIAFKPELHEPEWARSPVHRTVRAALLASSWVDGAEGDREVLEELAGCPYDEFKEGLAALAATEDPFITKIGSTWTVVSPIDAWQQLGPSIDGDDLKRFAATVEAVLLEEDPATELPRSERWWRASVEGRVRKHSGDLRSGLVASLALLGVEGSAVAEGIGGAVADATVRTLVENANEDASGERWASLAPHLPLLAEASPSAFLDGVRTACGGETPLVAALFRDGEADHDPMFGPGSPHTGLLWGLETAAWSPDHLAEVVYLLAAIAEVDHGGRLSNRPANSLESIFCL